MGDTVATKTLQDGARNLVVVLTNQSDGTGESAVKKVDISALNAGPQGVACTHVSIMDAQWAITGSGNVQLFFDAATDDAAIIMNGQGGLSLADAGGWVDPKSATPVGDVLLTTTGFIAGDSYNITLVFKKRYA